MVKRMYGGRRTRRRTMRGGRRTRRPSRKMYGGRRMRGGRRTRRTKRPRTRRSFMMYGGVRPLSETGGSTFVRHISLGDAEVNLKLLPKDGEEVASTGKISSDSKTNIAPFLKGNTINYDKMKWEVMVGGMMDTPLTIDGGEFSMDKETKPSKIILLFKETTNTGDELKYKMIHDEKTMNAGNQEVLDYVRKLVNTVDPNNPPNPE